MTASRSQRWIPSSKRNPCPICGRTKDGDCRTSGDGLEVICHHGKTHHPPEGLTPGKAVFQGNDGNQWAYTRITKDGRASHFTLDKPRDSSRGERRVIPLRPRSAAAAPAPAPIAGPICLARLPEPWPAPPAPRRPHGFIERFSPTQWVEVKRPDPKGKASHPPRHLDSQGKTVYAAGDAPWPLYAEVEALAADGWVVEAEGPKCADWIRAGGVVGISQPGHAHTPDQIQPRYQRLQAAGVAGVVFISDHDAEGAKRAAEAAAAAAAVGLPLLHVPASTVWPGLPAGGSIDDAPGSPADRVAAVERAVAAALQQAKPQTLDELLGPVEDGKLRRPRTDRLTRALALVLPLRYNLLTNRVELDGEPIHGDYLSGLYLDLAESHAMEVAKERAIDAALRVARQNAYHPVQNYLNGLSQQLSPEEWASLDVLCFGGEDPTGWAVVHLQRQLIGLVARALSPGCELHTCLILQSDRQGIGKSTFWKILGGEWFSDSLGDLRNVRDDRLQLHSAWIFEWGEIDNVMGKRESELLKRFISCSRDDVRKPYGRGHEQLLRSCGLVGTTNRRDFMKDPTGNRRFPIIQIGSVSLDWVKEHRDRIWGSAVAAYRSGQPWHYSTDEGAMVSAQARDFAAADPLRDRLESWAEDSPELDEVPIVRILWDLRGDSPEYWERRRDREFMRQIGLALTSLGWAAMGQRVRYLLPDGTRTDRVSLWKRP